MVLDVLLKSTTMDRLKFFCCFVMKNQCFCVICCLYFVVFRGFGLSYMYFYLFDLRAIHWQQYFRYCDLKKSLQSCLCKWFCQASWKLNANSVFCVCEKLLWSLCGYDIRNILHLLKSWPVPSCCIEKLSIKLLFLLSKCNFVQGEIKRFVLHTSVVIL